MAFTYTVNTDQLFGGMRIVTGTYTSAGGSTGGDIYTGLNTIFTLHLQPKSTAVVANQPAVNETMPKNSDGITIVTTANEVGTWIASGI
jgi:hypothetical protein